MYVHNNGELNHRQYSFSIKCLSTGVRVCMYKCGYSEVLSRFVAEPQTGFQIAFKMLDTDGNEQVEKKEFFKVCACICVFI